MELNRPRIRDVGRRLEISRRLDRILTRPNKRNNTILVEPARIINRLDKQRIQLVQLIILILGFGIGLVNRLESQELGLAPELGANLVPELVELLLDGGVVCVGLGEVLPCGGVVVDVDDGVEAAGDCHVDDVGDALEPGCVYGVGGRSGYEVVGPSD